MRNLASAIAVAGVLASASVASAADLAVRKAPPPPPPVWSWTGFYIGGHVGGTWGTTEAELNSITIAAGGLGAIGIGGLALPIAQTQTNGFLAGAQAGYNWQIAPWAVIGVEGDISWTDSKGTSPCIVVFSCRTEHDWVATAAARFGVTYDRALFYVKGGAAWAQTTYSSHFNNGGLFSVSQSDTRVGALFGTGIEYAFTPSWTAKVEYNYIDFGTDTYNFPFTIPNLVTVNFGTGINEKLHLVKAGLNYKFGGPVMANY
ncbi:MAG: porin family protein [Hyphomicrobiales bacterium]|nr:porin family protein [Hyphomicrobiales bacterium]